jgi:hypothetical protein
MSKCEKSVDFWVDELTHDINPEHFNHNENFIPYMHDEKISSFGDWMWNNGYNVGLYNLQTKINTYCVPQWISVKDRLPEKHGWYLTAHKKTYPTDSGIKICFFCHGYFTTDKEVTHWRPLPEYPESEEKSE